MGDNTGIGWTDATWNPLRGCSRVSEGCRNCYAERTAIRQVRTGYAGLVKSTPAGPRWTGAVRFVPEVLAAPFSWKKPRRIFVNSMSDLFHEGVKDGWVMRILNTMAKTPHHTYQILTKRPERMRSFFARWADLSGEDLEFKNAHGPEEVRKAHPSPRGQLFAAMLDAMGTPPEGFGYPLFDWMEGMILWPAWFSNVWLGVSVEDQAAADERIPLLLQTPAAVRFLSVEPLLWPVDLSPWTRPRWTDTGECAPWGQNIQEPRRIDWVIVGGESGPGHRPCKVEWIESVVAQCRAAGVPVWVKQDSGPRPGAQGRIPDDLWVHEFPASGGAGAGA